jgi:hypothetical protein
MVQRIDCPEPESIEGIVTKTKRSYAAVGARLFLQLVTETVSLSRSLIDSNAKSQFWAPNFEDPRGANIREFIDANGLHLLNDGVEQTFY